MVNGLYAARRTVLIMITAIVILTLIDIICTGIGVSNGFIGEGNPFLGMVGIHYQQNTLGSRSILGK